MTNSPHEPLTTNCPLTNAARVTSRLEAYDRFCSLPSDMLSTYNSLRYRETENFPSFETLLIHLSHLHRCFYNCYRWIELVYGDRTALSSGNDTAPPALPSNISERKKSIHHQKHITLRETAPEHWKYILQQLYEAQIETENLVGELHSAVEEYEDNLYRLYGAFCNKYDDQLARYDGDVDRVDNRLGRDVLAAAAVLQRLVDRDPDRELEWDPSCLGNIRTFWRTFGGREDVKPLEAVWEYVAGRELSLE